MRFAFLGRVSTEDAQDPEASRGWQLRRAQNTIDPVGGIIVAEYFDIGQSRSLPWERRPEASRLLADLKNPDRGFEAVVIGEPHRAFYGNQFSLTFPKFGHYGVGLWVPEVGGEVDPDSEAHDMLMNLFGGMSKAERSRVRTRVKNSMSDLAERTDRFLGGRPAYGYLLENVGPHPNPSKAAAGQQLHKLAPDPVTAPVISRVFSMFAEQDLGLRAIADILTAEGIPSPSAYDPARNRHRSPVGWSHTTIRSILKNPTYTGVRVWGKQERIETLIDPDDVAAGHRTILRWRDPNGHIVPPERTHAPLISDELFQLASKRLLAKTPGVRRPRASPHPYLLRGLLQCARCGSTLQGSYRHSRTESGGRVLYRCEIRRGRSLPPGDDHPPTLYVREDAILDPLDHWIESLADPDWLAHNQPDPEMSARRTALQTQLNELRRKITNLIAAIEASPSPTLLDQLSAREAEEQLLQAKLDTTAGPKTLSSEQIAALLHELGGIAGVLAEATPTERAEVYSELGITLVYDDRTHEVRATADLARVANRVGGGT